MIASSSHVARRFLASVTMFLVVVVATPATLVAASTTRFGSANPLAGIEPPWRWRLDELATSATNQLGDDTVVDVIVRVSLTVIWVAVVVVVVATAVDTVHLVRHGGLHAPAVRGLAWAQPVARTMAAGLVVLLPATTSSTPIAEAVAAATGPVGLPPTHSTSSVTTHPERPDPVRTVDYRVQPGDSVYAIAQRIAGGDDVIDVANRIVDANLGRTMPDGRRFTNPAYIEVGWILTLPHGVDEAALEATAAPASVATDEEPAAAHQEPPDPAAHEVQPGDTLWSIAERHLGDGGQWPRIWDLNAGRQMDDGRVFDDPDLILPGWRLDVGPSRTDPSAPDDAGMSAAPAPPPVPPPDDTPSPPAAESTPSDTGNDRAVQPSADRPPTGPSSTVRERTATTTQTTVPTTTPDARTASAAPQAGSAPHADAPPVRLEYAAIAAAGILALVGVRRRRRLRATVPGHRLRSPHPAAAAVERRLRTLAAAERAARIDVACRSIAESLPTGDARIGWLVVAPTGAIDVRLTAPGSIAPPWTGEARDWHLDPEVTLEALAPAATRVDMPCPALVQIGVTPDGDDVLLDLEAAGTLHVGAADADRTDEIVTGLAAALSGSAHAEVVHLIAVSLPEAAFLHHRHAHRTDSADAAFELAGHVAADPMGDDRSTFALRSLRSGGESWEPAVVFLLRSDRDPAIGGDIPTRRGIAVVSAADETAGLADASLIADDGAWLLQAFGAALRLRPIGLPGDDLEAVSQLVDDAERTPRPPATDDRGTDTVEPVEEYEDPVHSIVVGLIGRVTVSDRDGTNGEFERSKTVELIAWLATHRDRATRTGARTALWELDVRDATFANVVSEARRAMARLITPPEGTEWLARTMTDELPLHPEVVTDADLVAARIEHARRRAPRAAMETLRPAVSLVRDVPFAGTDYLWPDAEGITSELVMLAITACGDYAEHALAVGDVEGVFWATRHGLKVLPGHETLVGFRMRAHASRGDLAGVRHEWASYERALCADPWSDGEPAADLVALRNGLLGADRPPARDSSRGNDRKGDRNE